MQSINLRLTDEQVEVLDNISDMCGKNSLEFIKDTLFTILPVKEFMALKRYLEVAEKLKNNKENKKVIKTISKMANDIQLSANARLKRIGVL